MRKSFSISILFISLFVIPMTNILVQAQWKTLILPNWNMDSLSNLTSPTVITYSQYSRSKLVFPSETTIPLTVEGLIFFYEEYARKCSIDTIRATPFKSEFIIEHSSNSGTYNLGVYM